MSNLIQLSSRVQLKPYKPRPFIHREYLFDAELLQNAGGTLIVDTETYPNYFLISFKCVKTGKYLVMEAPFNERKLSWIMHNYTTISFNGIKYDLPMIWKAFQLQDIPTLQRLSNALILEGLWHAEAQKVFGFKIYPTPHIDLIEVAPLKGSLKLYAARIHARRIQELPFPPNQALSDEQKEHVKHYNFNDLDDTHLLLDFMKERIELRYAMSQEYDENLLSKSDAQIAEVVLVKKVAELSGKPIQRPVIPAGTVYKYDCPQFLMFATEPMKALLDRIKKADFIIQDSGKILSPPELKDKVKIGDTLYSVGIGGLHSFDDAAGYKADDENDITDADVVSYYPNAILNLKLIPISMGESFLTVFKGFKDERVIAKRTKNFTKDKGLKIFLNGTSGKFSDFFSKMYYPKLTIQMNITGQLSILMLAEMLTLQGMKVINANTDGITIYHKKADKEKLKYWIDYWSKLTNFEMEFNNYAAFYFRDVNAYFAVKKDAKTIKDVKVKGPWSEVGSQSGTQLDTNPSALICTDAVSKFLLDGTPVDQTIRTCKDFTRFIVVRQCKAPGAHKDGEYLGKVLRWAYVKNEYGTINYVETNNKVPMSEGARPYLDLPKEFPLDLDYEKYIILAQEILMDIAYYPRPKQQTLF